MAITISNVEGADFKIDWGNYASKINGKFTEAQKTVDSEVLRLCNPYTPMDSGDLIKSSVISTVIGSGLVQWTMPYARKMYYGEYDFRGGPIKGSHWGSRAMQNGGYAAIVKKIGGVMK